MQTFSSAGVEIDYDLNGAENWTVLTAGARIGGESCDRFALAALNGSPGNFQAMTDPILDALPKVWDAVDTLQKTTPGSFVFRDAADRFHEALVGIVWASCMRSGHDQLGLQFVLKVFDLALDWERKGAAKAAYIHKGCFCMYAAIAAFRLRNVDLGVLFLEAGEDADRRTYALAGYPSLATTRPGTLTLTLRPNAGNMLYADVMAMRHVVELRLQSFHAESGIPAGQSLIIDNLDALYFEDPDSRTGTKLVFGLLMWKAHAIDDLLMMRIPHDGPYTSRRRAELLLGVFTATEQIVRRVVGRTGGHYIEVLKQVVWDEWPGKRRPEVEVALRDIRANHGEDPAQCLAFWAKPLPMQFSAVPWFLQWLECARSVRNGIAHDLETAGPVVTDWATVEKVAWYAFFAAIWLLRRKQLTSPPAAAPTLPPGWQPYPTPAPNSFSFGTQIPIMPSGVAI